MNKRKKYLGNYDFTVNGSGEEIAVDPRTGVVCGTQQITVPDDGGITKHYSPAQLKANREYREREAAKQVRERQRRSDSMRLGKFFFVRDEPAYLGMSPPTISRLVYLCTFLRSNDSTLYSGIRSGTPMRKDDLPSVLGVSRNTAEGFLTEASPCLKVLEDGRLSIDRECFRLGVLESGSGSFRKLYIQAVRSLYKSVPPSKHRYLGYLFALLPYVNLQWNILCWNPQEKDLYAIEAMSLQQFCEKIGYDPSNAGRLKREYQKIYFKCRGREQFFCAFVSGNGQGDLIAINPNVLYNGDAYDNVMVFGRFCDCGRKKQKA